MTHATRITLRSAVHSDILRALRSACSPFGSLTWTTAIPGLMLAYVGGGPDYGQRTLTVEAGIALLRATRDVSASTEWSEVLLGAFRVQLITPTSGTVIELRRDAGGWTLTVDFGSGGSDHRADQIIEHDGGEPTLAWQVTPIGVTTARRIGDRGEVRCGDLMGPHDGVRLYGACCRSVDVVDADDRITGSRMANPAGCGDLLERLRDLEDIEPAEGWQDRVVERAQREGVLPPG